MRWVCVLKGLEGYPAPKHDVAYFPAIQDRHEAGIASLGGSVPFIHEDLYVPVPFRFPILLGRWLFDRDLAEIRSINELRDGRHGVPAVVRRRRGPRGRESSFHKAFGIATVHSNREPFSFHWGSISYITASHHCLFVLLAGKQRIFCELT